ncbi:hypothetical protein A1353_09120 [Methylomonas methanica]|uniref:Uncharacterized protein n=1 Tax=Methylomonas methanica TaxID=421 RepID=A0A177MKR0_METMH|nr:hypothetical protein A1353_09120 [Methylomonas methanica]
MRWWRSFVNPPLTPLFQRGELTPLQPPHFPPLKKGELTPLQPIHFPPLKKGGQGGFVQTPTKRSSSHEQATQRANRLDHDQSG